MTKLFHKIMAVFMAIFIFAIIIAGILAVPILMGIIIFLGLVLVIYGSYEAKEDTDDYENHS